MYGLNRELYATSDTDAVAGSSSFHAVQILLRLEFESSRKNLSHIGPARIIQAITYSPQMDGVHALFQMSFASVVHCLARLESYWGSDNPIKAWALRWIKDKTRGNGTVQTLYSGKTRGVSK